ncbi:PIN domain-like protein [Tricholoma matsutake]|nr:PIN domain-like protein [Tricholoma matsutake 945]
MPAHLIFVLQAHGEAEAELAWMSREGLIDAVFTDDSDVFVFGASNVLQVVPGDSKDHQVIVYNQESICELGFCQEDFILIALLAGGDYSVSKPCQ